MSNRLFVPMRSADLSGDITLIVPHLPCYLSPKLDGYRATVQGDNTGMPCVFSKNNKPIPNGYVQRMLSQELFVFMDGELIVGSPTEPGSLQRTSSGVTTRAGEPDFTFWVFDDLSGGTDKPFEHRLRTLKARVGKGLPWRFVKVVPHQLVKTLEEAIAYEAKCVAMGYEGVMARARLGAYKQGGAEPRATLTQLEVAKLKRVEHHEARVVGVYEEMENANEATRDELGRTKRSTHKAGKRGKNTLGGCHVVGVGGRWDGVAYDVGGGWTKPEREALWGIHNSKTAGRLGYQPLVGRIMKVETGITPPTFKAPQFPRFVDWKWQGDM